MGNGNGVLEQRTRASRAKRPASRSRPSPSPSLSPSPIRGHRVGRLVRFEGGQPVVELDGVLERPVVARMTSPPPLGAAPGAEVLLVFEEERPDRPIVVGWLRSADSAEVHVDGTRIELTAADEVVLRCGEASLTLRRNGRVVLRGAYVETRARGVNRIRGGSVSIN